jgi:hypothetical protein
MLGIHALIYEYEQRSCPILDDVVGAWRVASMMYTSLARNCRHQPATVGGKGHRNPTSSAGVGIPARPDYYKFVLVTCHEINDKCGKTRWPARVTSCDISVSATENPSVAP